MVASSQLLIRCNVNYNHASETKINARNQNSKASEPSHLLTPSKKPVGVTSTIIMSMKQRSIQNFPESSTLRIQKRLHPEVSLHSSILGLGSERLGLNEFLNNEVCKLLRQWFDLFIQIRSVTLHRIRSVSFMVYGEGIHYLGGKVHMNMYLMPHYDCRYKYHTGCSVAKVPAGTVCTFLNTNKRSRLIDWLIQFILLPTAKLEGLHLTKISSIHIEE